MGSAAGERRLAQLSPSYLIIQVVRRIEDAPCGSKSRKLVKPEADMGDMSELGWYVLCVSASSSSCRTCR